jgi:simple sugar transport system ATP-binding protein
MRIGGQPYTATREQMARFRLSCLPEEPLANACVGRMTVAENLAFRLFDRPPFTFGGAFVSPQQMRSHALGLISRFAIRTDGPAAKAETLSGGNVQRMVLARELSHDVEVLIVANPCFGLDVKAIAEIRGKIIEARNRGAAVLLVSEDLDEIFELADRIIVMSDGAIVMETSAAEADRASVGHAMAGQASGTAGHGLLSSASAAP